MKMYIAIREDFPDFMTPTLVASDSFKKVTVRVSRKEFDKIAQLPMVVEKYILATEKLLA